MLANIKIRDFRGVESADLQLSPNISLIAGSNHVGKTSVMQALVSAFLGAETPIPKLQKQKAGLLVRTGSPSGEGWVEMDQTAGTRRVFWPSCKVETDGEPATSNEFAVGYWDILELEPEKKAAEISKATGSSPTPDDLRDELRRAEIDEERIEAEVAQVFGVFDLNGGVVRPAKGFDSAHESAKTMGQGLKRDSEKLTGIRFGSAQTGNWIPQGWEQDLFAASKDSLEEALATAKSHLENAIAEQAISEHERVRLQEVAANAQELADKAANLRDVVLKKAEEDIKNYEQNNPRPHTAGPGGFQQTYECPHCQGAFIIKNEKAVVPEQGKVSQKELREQQAELAKWVKALDELRAGRDRIMAEYHAASGAASGARVAQEKLVELKQAGEQFYDVEKCRESVRHAEIRLQAFLKKSESDRIYESVLANQRVIDVLAPDGLRQKKLGEALKRINARLEELCQAAGFRNIEFTRELSATMGGRQYSLLSKSEQFRVQVVLRVALAQMTGAAIILVDAADILDAAGKAGLFRLLKYAQIPSVVAMTLPKQFVPNLQDGVVYWMENGVATRMFEEVPA